LLSLHQYPYDLIPEFNTPVIICWRSITSFFTELDRRELSKDRGIVCSSLDRKARQIIPAVAVSISTCWRAILNSKILDIWTLGYEIKFPSIHITGNYTKYFTLMVIWSVVNPQ